MREIVASVGLALWWGSAAMGYWRFSCVAMLALWLMSRAWPAPPVRVAMPVIDALGVRRKVRGQLERIDWKDLVEVFIITTSDGPFGEDLFWGLRATDGSGCAVPGAAAGPLLRRLQRLPRFDNVAAIKAAGSTTAATFVVWAGTPGEALVCADDLPAVVDEPPAPPIITPGRFPR